jgi:hypothetical protein
MSRIVPIVRAIRYEAQWARKTARPRWFTGQVAEPTDGGQLPTPEGRRPRWIRQQRSPGRSGNDRLAG